ncbi:MAG TPA: thrombospondin type 3 repeat-containing protein [Verrucomicrobiae bacterium]|nr:thrombospondin type 3 repeat-containing protein [Verrucomicrobiae bacterium]
MKTHILLFVLVALNGSAATTINSVNKLGYGANIGWMNWQGDAANGGVIGAFVCSGNVWGANVGWINLGSGSPANGIRYQNNGAADFGVNHDGAGNLTGYGYGANIGWLTFTNRDAGGTPYEGPKVDLLTGRLSGFVWSANCGWISLSNQFAYVQTDSINYGPDSDGDGIPDAWELQFAPNLGVLNGAGDNDGDGLSNAEEFIADTNPLDPNSNLRIMSIAKADPPSPTKLTWTSSPTRVYRIRSTMMLADPQPWPDIGLGLLAPDPGTSTTRNVGFNPEDVRFFVIEAVQPLP